MKPAVADVPECGRRWRQVPIATPRNCSELRLDWPFERALSKRTKRQPEKFSPISRSAALGGPAHGAEQILPCAFAALTTVSCSQSEVPISAWVEIP
jgi:hypothetical protein